MPSPMSSALDWARGASGRSAHRRGDRSGTGSIKTAFRPDIEGLRAIAVLFVLIWHAGVPWLTGGFVGVDVFFVISGFLMTTILHREHIKYRRINVVKFYARRARRLVPASTLALVATGLATVMVLPETRWRDIGIDIAAAGGYVVNWRLAERAVDYLAQGSALSPVQHFWSLSVEEQFYIFWPLVIVAVAWTVKWARGSVTTITAVALAAIAGGSLCWSVYLTASDQSRAYFVTTTRVWELALGGLTALAMPAFARLPKRLAVPLAWIGLLGILGSGLLINSTVPFPGSIALIPTLSTAMVIAASPSAGMAGPLCVFANRPTQWIGSCSYSMYLWHWPVLVIGGYWISGGLREVTVFEGLVLVSLSVLPAWLSLRYVENPIRESNAIKDSVANSLGLAVFGIAICLLVGMLVALQVRPTVVYQSRYVQPGTAGGGGEPIGAEVLGEFPLESAAGRPVDVVSAITPSPNAAQNDIPDQNACQLSYAETTPRFCVFGDAASATTVVLVGDSHTGQWLPALNEVALERGWKLVVSIKSACPYLDVDVFAVKLNRPYNECTDWNQQVAAYLTGPEKPAAVVVSYSQYLLVGERNINSGADNIIAGAAARWQPLVAQGSKVIVLRDTPSANFNMPECVAEHTNELSLCSTPRDEALSRRDETQPAAVASVTGAQLVDLTDWICPGSSCPAVIGGVIVFRDDSHMTATYSRSLSTQLAKSLPPLP